MRIRRAVIIPAILALGAAGSVLVGPAMPSAAGHTPASSVQAAASSTPAVHYRA